MKALYRARPGLHLVRRTITRAPGLGGKDYDATTEVEFDTLVQNGALAEHWSAHGLRYGIPVTARNQLARRTECIVNFSRKALIEGAAQFTDFVVINVAASPETQAERLRDRGRAASSSRSYTLSSGNGPDKVK